MDAHDSASRQSRPSSAPNSEPASSTHSYPYREPVDRMHHERPPMAASNILNQSNSYPSAPPSSYPTYPPPAATMISNEARKSADDSDPSKRQSLPSLSEVISGKPGHYPPPATGIPPTSGFPSHYSSNPPPPPPPPARAYQDNDKHASQALSALSARQEPLSSYSGSPRPSFAGRPGLPAVSDRRPSPTGRHELPHGQLPLPYYPVSPRHAPPPSLGQYDPRSQSIHEENERGRLAYEALRTYEPWAYPDALARLGQCSKTLYNFAEAYSRIASEQHGAHPIPERLPSESEVTEMIAHADMMKYALDQVREVILQSLRSERAREGPKGKGVYDDDQDVAMYGDGMKQHYAMTPEVKKRRGRAAPPGRCHSCNRIDTPEWRRGPDGARTLCNACGLHYAKLERKRQLEARSIRPKPDDRS